MRIIKMNLFLIIISILMFTILNPSRVSGEINRIAEVEKKLDGITEKEHAILVDLFTLTQEIEAMEREEIKLSFEMDELQLIIQSTEAKIEDKQIEFKVQLDILKKVLRSYQRRGPASLFEIILSSKDLKSFIRSINIIREISRSQEELLKRIEHVKNELWKEKEIQIHNINNLNMKKEELKIAYEEKLKLKKDQEDCLNSLNIEKEHYEEQLNNLEVMWDELKVLFANFITEFEQIIDGGHFTTEDLQLSFNFFTLKGSIKETRFNEILKRNKSLSNVEFHFLTDQVEIVVPDKRLRLKGKFEIDSKTEIKFIVQEGSFYELPLERGSIDELFRNGQLTIDFIELAGDMIIFDITLEAIKIREGSLEFEVKPKF